MSRSDRRRRQAQREAEYAAEQQERPNIPPRAVPLSEQCPARLGSRHDFTMNGRCWYCCKPKPAPEPKP